MWLDRLTNPGSATSQPNSRTTSPLPPRRVPSQRGPHASPQQPTRTNSSSSIGPNGPNGSLLASARRVNGSTLKQSQGVEADVDSLAILDKILGVESTTTKGNRSGGHVEEADVDAEFDFGGLSLRQIANGAQCEPVEAAAYRPQTIEEYAHDRSSYEELQKSIRACDVVLASVETNLVSFRDDLAAVSADIETLQARSAALTVRLENRKAVEKALGPIVEELSISPVVVQKISEGSIDESWLKALAELDKRTASYKRTTQNQQHKAVADLGPLLESLELKAIERIRDFLVAQIKALRSPQINAQILQQQNFLKYKDLFTFLHKHHAILAEEICEAYINTMRWYYANRFERYRKSLQKLKLHIIDKADVLGHEDTARKATVLGATRTTSGAPHDAFNLGRRIDLLKTTNQTAISSHLAEEDTSAHYLEVPFRNLNLAIVDNATAEYTFLASFFHPAISLATVGRHFNSIFEPTFTLGRTTTRLLASETYDALGLLLCIRFMQHLAFELQRRRVPAADGYVNSTTMELWPRLQVVMSAHCESVRALTASLPTTASAAARKAASAAPHVVTQRFGQLVQGVLSLSVEAGDDEPIVASLGRLRSDVEAFLGKYSQTYFGKDKRKAQRFLFNNFSLVGTIISDVDGGKWAEEMKAHFEESKERYQEDA